MLNMPPVKHRFTGIISNFALFAAAYVPAGLLSSFLVAGAVRPVIHRQWAAALAAVILVGLGAWGVRERLGDPQPARHTLAIPVYPELSTPQQQYVVETIARFVGRGQ